MDHVDIGEAITRKDVREVERAYRAIIGYPGEDRLDAPSAAHLMVVLGDVTAFLAQDTSIMPEGTCSAANLPAGSTYADAAANFIEHRQWWHSHLVARVGKGE